MGKSHPKDKIDAELAKTYFSTAFNTRHAAKSQTITEASHKSRDFVTVNPVVKSGKTKIRLKTILILLAIIFTAGVTGFLFYFDPGHAVPSGKTAETPETSRFANPPSRTILPAPAIELNKTLYDFEKNTDGWEIPAWAKEKDDHVASALYQTSSMSHKGTGSIMFQADFLKGKWSAALVEIQHYLDLSKYTTISAYIYTPFDSPEKLRAGLILTVGDDWRFVEMSRNKKLVPGEWTEITADISEGSIDWKRTVVDKAFKEDVRKIAVRITSNGTQYSGIFHIDNIKLKSL